jgi:hypothetical protein
MKTVWKYPFEVKDTVELAVPMGAELLHVDTQGPLQPCMWFGVDTEKPKAIRRFLVRGTGHDCEGTGEHVASFQLRGGSLVFHVFEPK